MIGRALPKRVRWGAWLAAPAVLLAACSVNERRLHVSPAGDDGAPGTRGAPFRTLHRAQEAARALARDMRGDIIVEIGPGEYRMDRPLVFTEADSGRNGFRIIYRSAAGPGKAVLLGSQPLTGWQPHRDRIWKVGLPPKTVFHTLYENGRRAHKARFPDLERDPRFPVALGRYAVSTDGTPKQTDKPQDRTRGPGWLAYGPEDAPPVSEISKMRLHIFPGGKCDWVREVHAVTAIDPQARRLTFDIDPIHGVGVGARFFLEDELGFLNAPGEFFLNEKEQALYYMPEGEGHPDGLKITRPALGRMIEFRGKSRDLCVSGIALDGLALAETDNAPPQALWAYDGMKDGAMIWLNNASRIEIRDCHLRHGGRSGIMMIGHNVGNRVTGCWIEHMGLNGVSLCNRFRAPGGKDPTPDRCEGNAIHNTRISHVGELHTYAECVTVFNASSNEVAHCELDNSVRYAITVRGNTGAQYGPPITVPYPPARGNRFHHIRVSGCGQDGGDMGALHAANLNNPGGGNVNTFEQITVADTAAIASVQDIAPDGIFLDWPKMAMDQVFRNVEIVRSQGMPLRSNGPDNEASAQMENVSWKPGFRQDLMDYENIGLTKEFPPEFGGRRRPSPTPPAPARLQGRADSHERVTLEWDPVAGDRQAEYAVARDGVIVGRCCEPRWVDRTVRELTAYRYGVAARIGDFSRFGPASEHKVLTPADRNPPEVTGVRVSPDGRRVRVAFSEPVDAASSAEPSGYRFEPELSVRGITHRGLAAVELDVEGTAPAVGRTLRVVGVADQSAARNRLADEKPIPVGRFDLTVRYPLDAPAGGDWLEDASGGGGCARLFGGAKVEAGAGPGGASALVLDGAQGFAEGPDDLNLGPGDFTFCVWIWRERAGVIVSKGNGFGAPDQWSFGDGSPDAPGGVALRINNKYFSTAARAVKDRRWIHLAFVRHGAQGATYVDGLPSGGPHDMSGIGPLANDRPLRIGRREHQPNPMWFKGRIAGLAIWPRALNPEEVRKEASPPHGAIFGVEKRF